MSHEHAHRTSADDIEMLDLDGTVLADYWSAVHDLVDQHAPDEVRTVLDLGSGSGNGALGFAARFPDAAVTAVDTDETMLAHISDRAAERDVRVITTHVDLDTDFPDVEDVDVAWASLSLHHLTDPDRVLTELHAAMRSGGLVAVAEMREPLRFLSDDDVEERVLAIMRGRLEHELPHLGSDWPARLAAAGFSVVDAHEVEIDVASAPGANRYAWLWFDRLRDGLAEDLTDADRAALAELLDGDGPDAIMRRTDLHVRGTRTVLLARA